MVMSYFWSCRNILWRQWGILLRLLRCIISKSLWSDSTVNPLPYKYMLNHMQAKTMVSSSLSMLAYLLSVPLSDLLAKAIGLSPWMRHALSLMRGELACTVTGFLQLLYLSGVSYAFQSNSLICWKDQLIRSSQEMSYLSSTAVSVAPCDGSDKVQSSPCMSPLPGMTGAAACLLVSSLQCLGSCKGLALLNMSLQRMTPCHGVIPASLCSVWVPLLGRYWES